MSKSHCHTTVVVSAGMAQASISPTLTSSRMPRPSARRSRAIRRPRPMVSPTFTMAKMIVRHRTSQK